MKAMLFAFMTATLTGCGGVLECNDSDAKETVLNIMKSELEKAAWYRDIQADISDIELSEISTLSKTMKQKADPALGNIISATRSKFDEDINYDLHYLEDKKDTKVSVATDDVKAKVMAVAMFAH